MKPLLVYDGDCGFCRLWIDRWRALTGDRVAYVPFQLAARDFPEIPLKKFQQSVQLILPGGEVHSAADAVFRLFTYADGGGRLHWIYENVPGARSLSEWIYRITAEHRPGLDPLVRLLWGHSLRRPEYVLTRWLFLRLLSLVYVFAFFSLFVQIEGLAGSRGILPVHNFLTAIGTSLGSERYWAFPTLAWISSSDAALRWMSLGGGLLSIAALAGVLQLPIFAALWVLYLSLVIAGQDFLSFQWDILLLESGFLAILLAPWQFLAGSERRRPSRLVIWLLRILLFRLMFSSGMVKLASGDPTWRNLTALHYHYETQPLPTPAAWYMYQLPLWFQKLSTAVTLGIELAVPFFLLAPRRLRFLAAAAIAFLQTLILLTGNYAFFNLLTLALCIPALDDAFVGRFLPGRLARKLTENLHRESRFRRLAVAVCGAAIVFGGAVQVLDIVARPPVLPEFAERLINRLTRFHIISSYGLFAVMTTTRPEILVEGSNDRETWLAYEFKYKPGDLKRRPPIVAPHQPRLDWQMWFAALGDYRSNPWFVNLVVRLLEGAPEVLALLEKNPFPAAPPRYIRASRCEYEFTDFATKRAGGAWWQRKPAGLYFPAASLRKQ
jgi:predicted DCC family thiol-disulfide oxidoreductase YuxK